MSAITPLLVAVEYNSTAVAELLIRSGADVNTRYEVSRYSHPNA